MNLYNVEIFDEEFNFIENTTVESAKYKEDYLDPEKSKVILTVSPAVRQNFFIRMYNDSYEYSGIISEIKAKSDGTQEITFTSVESLLDREVLIYVDEIAGTMENYIKARIDELYVTATDTSQRLPMTVTVSSTTQNWDIDYKIENEQEEETEEREVAFINILDDLILPAFSSYDIVLDFTIDVPNKQILIDVGKNTAGNKTIETDLSNIIDKEITIRKAKKRVNKVNIWNKKDFNRAAIYYLHSDDSFDQTDEDRLTPVSYKNVTVSTDNNAKCIEKKVKNLNSEYSTVSRYNKIDPEERTQEDIDEAVAAMTDVNSFMDFGWTFNNSDSLIYDADNILVGQETWGDEGDEFKNAIEAWAETEDAAEYGETTAAELFEDKAYSKALSTFSKNKYDNLIEIEVAVDDSRVQPLDLKIGQQTTIIADGVAYQTVLSGREIYQTATLIFGTIRLELTKMLKGRA